MRIKNWIRKCREGEFTDILKNLKCLNFVFQHHKFYSRKFEQLVILNVCFIKYASPSGNPSSEINPPIFLFLLLSFSFPC